MKVMLIWEDERTFDTDIFILEPTEEELNLFYECHGHIGMVGFLSESLTKLKDWVESREPLDYGRGKPINVNSNLDKVFISGVMKCQKARK